MSKSVSLHVFVWWYVRGCVQYVREKQASEPHKIVQGYHLPYLPAENQGLHMLCDLVGCEDGRPLTALVTVLSNRVRREEEQDGFWGKRVFKGPVLLRLWSFLSTKVLISQAS